MNPDFSLKPRKSVKIGIDLIDYVDAAKRLGCKLSHIRAVDAVESAGSGFLADKRPKILFEGHIFHNLTKGKFSTAEKVKKHFGYAADLPVAEIQNTLHRKVVSKAYTISYPKWTKKFYKGGAAEYDRLELAFLLDPAAALKSASWSRFQVLGKNFRLCGFTDVFDFVEAMFADEDNALEAFIGYVEKTGLSDELRAGNWDAFALGYNGFAYKRNNYHVKLDVAEKKFAAQGANDSKKISRLLAKEVSIALPCETIECSTAQGVPATIKSRIANTSLDSRYETEKISNPEIIDSENTPDTLQIPPVSDQIPALQTATSLSANSIPSSPIQNSNQTVSPEEADNPQAASSLDYLRKKSDQATEIKSRADALGLDTVPLTSKFGSAVLGIGRFIWKHLFKLLIAVGTFASENPLIAAVVILAVILYVFRKPLTRYVQSIRTASPANS